MSNPTILDATPENSNDEGCDVCKAEPNMPCVYSTNPPTVRDRMHYQRVEAARKALRPAHELSLSFAQATDSRQPVSAILTVTDSNTGEILHRYDLSEHHFMRMLRGGVILASDEMTGGPVMARARNADLVTRSYRNNTVAWIRTRADGEWILAIVKNHTWEFMLATNDRITGSVSPLTAAVQVRVVERPEREMTGGL